MVVQVPAHRLPIVLGWRRRPPNLPPLWRCWWSQSGLNNVGQVMQVATAGGQGALERADGGYHLAGLVGAERQPQQLADSGRVDRGAHASHPRALTMRMISRLLQPVVMHVTSGARLPCSIRSERLRPQIGQVQRPSWRCHVPPGMACVNFSAVEACAPTMNALLRKALPPAGNSDIANSFTPVALRGHGRGFRWLVSFFGFLLPFSWMLRTSPADCVAPRARLPLLPPRPA